VRGQGFAYLRRHDVDVQVGLLARPATRLNQAFFTRVLERRPFVTLKAALSVDGFLAGDTRARTILTSAPANRHAHAFRAEVDAIAVGVGTVLADDPWLTARGVFRAQPLIRVVFDRDLRTPPEARVLSTRDAGPVIIVARDDAGGAARARVAPRPDFEAARRRLERAGAMVVTTPGGTVREGLVRVASEWDVGSVLLEGGAALHAAAWDEGVVDFVRLYVTPHVLGGGVRFLADRCLWSGAFCDGRTEPIGPDVVIEGYVHGPR
jgi:diaminohydroxyphosphoribosylaminopyrimidine deaminase / 5-amino-6-(5-phosphoribosylamino)uracil reductase